MEETIHIEVNDQDVDDFRANGFLQLEQMASDFELSWLRYVHDSVVKAATGSTPLELQNIPSDELGQVPVISVNVHESLITIVSPDQWVPDLNQTHIFHNARLIFSQLLGIAEERLRLGWRIFCKLAHGSETPWHQDAAYRVPPHTGASLWIPLDPSTAETSCLSYIRRSHLSGFHTHHFHEDHLVAKDVDTSYAITCPRSAGEAIAHHCLTIHFAGPNTSSRPRRSFSIICNIIE